MGHTVERKLREIVEDLRCVATSARSEVTVHRGNSKFLSDVLPVTPKPSAVITSPPYPNRFSYARETRPHLFFLNFITHPRAVGQLETDAIGGTWGKATSVLAEGVKPANETIKSLILPHIRSIDDRCGLMAS